MAGRGGIYRGPGGEKLYGDGREVEPAAAPTPVEPDGSAAHPFIATTVDGVCRYTGKPMRLCGCGDCDTREISAGEWVQPVTKGYLMECCGCGLVHSLDFRIIDGQVQFRAFRSAAPAESQGVERAQPVEAKTIPRDLKALYEANSGDRMMHERIIRQLIERIAELEASRG